MCETFKSGTCVLRVAAFVWGLSWSLAMAVEVDCNQPNLAAESFGGRMRSWEPGVPTIPEYEPEKANDGSYRSSWTAPSYRFPADLGVEWEYPQEVSSVIVRYLTADVLPYSNKPQGSQYRSTNTARTQPFAQVQCWVDGRWKQIDAKETECGRTVVRYEFPPVKTTRVRLLFAEQPRYWDTAAQMQSDIYVAELEVYRRPPFAYVYSDVPPTDTSTIGPLVVEPQQVRHFSDTLRPTLIVSESPWASKACKARVSNDGTCLLENGFIRLTLTTNGQLEETRLGNCVTGESIATGDSQALVIRTSQGDLTPGDFKVVKSDVVAAGPDKAELCITLTSEEVDVAVHYQLRRQSHYYHKWLTIANKGPKALRILDVTVSSLDLPRTAHLSAGPEHQELTYPVTALEKGGFFSCLQTIHWDHVGHALTYYPGTTVPPRGTFTSEKAVVGVYKNRGRYWLGMDQGVREWVIEYHAQISPATHYPYVYCEGWTADTRLPRSPEDARHLEQLLAMAKKLGIRYMDGYQPMHAAMEAPAEQVDTWLKLMGQNGIATGWWIDFGSGINWGDDSSVKMPITCMLSPETEAYFQELIRFVGEKKLKAFHWGDFLTIWPCNDPSHGHLPGKYSIYAQGQRVLEFGRQLREASPGLALGGDWGWCNPQYNAYLDLWQHNDNYDISGAISPDIHLDRLNAQMNRRYNLMMHGYYLHPWYRRLNSVNRSGQKDSHSLDVAGYRYGLLSALSLTASVTLNDIPVDMPQSEIEFTRRWLDWAKENKDYLKQTDVLFDRTTGWRNDVTQGTPELLGGTAHIRKDRGFVFLMNSSAREQVADLKLDLDAPRDARFLATEVYPGGMTLRGPESGLYRQGGTLRITVPAKQVRIVHVAPASSIEGVHGIRPEDARLAPYRRYLGQWSIERNGPRAAVMQSSFEYPSDGAASLAQDMAEEKWQAEPWAYNKAYIVLMFKDENRDLNDNWVSDAVFESNIKEDQGWVKINGVSKKVNGFVTRRAQYGRQVRCYFVELSSETKAGAANKIEVAVPIYVGTVFTGAYLDLPDQMP